MAAVKVIRAAGGLVWRQAKGSGSGGGSGGSGSGVEVVLVHRPRYDDWTLPKGKLDAGEHLLAAAVREVREETGVVGSPQVRLPSSRYLTGMPDTEKTVDWWSMQAVSQSAHTATNEVDEVRWVKPARAEGLLTYAHDRGVLAAFMALPLVTGVAVVVRHARAGKASEWPGDDDERPLDREGKRQTAALAPLLASFRPARVYSAPVVRCVDTVAPIGLPVRVDTVFAERTAAAPKAVADRIRALVAEAGRIVVCTQGAVVAPALAALRPPNTAATERFQTPKGDAWVLSFAGPELIAADPLPPV
jgi:8-oxo-dGTP diphosphatase